MILATAIAEKLHQRFPDARIDMLVKQGNETALEHHAFLNRVLTFNKKKNRLQELLRLCRLISSTGYDTVINLHRFASSGFLTWCSGARQRVGFSSNPFSFCYTRRVVHAIGAGADGTFLHETERNQRLIEHLTDPLPARPRIYVSAQSRERIHALLKEQDVKQFVCLAPASVWFTKQWPQEKWIELISMLPADKAVVLIGGSDDFAGCQAICRQAAALPRRVINLAGRLSVNETAALMEQAAMNYVNDSAPLHIASAVNAPVTAVFCSTVPAFGFGPLSERSFVLETEEQLSCRPCGLHGHRRCPQGHFRCAYSISPRRVAATCPV